MDDTLRFIIGIGAIIALVGAYEGIYLLNKYLRSKLSAERQREIEADVRRFGSCCGSPESCTLEAKISERRDPK
jgi:hypothetical protein